MLFLCFLLSCFLLTVSSNKDKFIGLTYNWSALNKGKGFYVEAKLTVYVDLNGVIVSNTTGTGCVTIVDIQGGKIYYDLTCAAGGKFALFSNHTTYNYENLQFGNGNGCGVVTGIGYQEEVLGYARLKSQPGSTKNHLIYAGQAGNNIINNDFHFN